MGVSVLDILRLKESERDKLYSVYTEEKQIHKIWLDGNEYGGYKAFSFFYELVYKEEPTRGDSGAIEDLNNYVVFIVPHLKINYSMMSIDDYRAITKQFLEKREYTLKCYDVIYDKMVLNKVYIAPLEFPKLFIMQRYVQGEKHLQLIGVQDTEIELIGTLNDISNVSVTYHLNPPISGVADLQVGEPNIQKGSDFIVGQSASEITNYQFDGWKFKCWNTQKNATSTTTTNNYENNSIFSDIITDLVFYAVWQNTNEYTLSYSYGVGTPKIDNQTMQQIGSKVFKYGESIGELPTSEALPIVTYLGKEYQDVYTNPQWYKTSLRQGTPLQNNEKYWIYGNSTIYQLYEIKKSTINYYVEKELYSTIASVEYGASVQLPTLVKSGYTFDGWYIDDKYSSKFVGIMPPYKLNLYARWKKI